MFFKSDFELYMQEYLCKTNVHVNGKSIIILTILQLVMDTNRFNEVSDNISVIEEDGDEINSVV